MPASIGRMGRSVYSRRGPFAKIGQVSWLYIALLVLAIAVVGGAEWPRLQHALEKRMGPEARRRREREKRKTMLHVVPNDADDFAASVERDLAQLPTIEETDRPNR